MKLTWIGHSCFKIEKDGYTVILDPYEDGSVPGLPPMREKANLVLCSHGHSDHNAVDLVEIEEAGENPFTITTIDTYHDDTQGSQRGPSRIHIFEDGETKVIHLGDLGCELTPDQLEQIRGADVILIPVGGFFTIDANQAAELIEEVQPKIAIPMHYRDELMGFGYDEIDTVDEFMDRVEDVTILSSSEVDSTDDLPSQVVLLKPQIVG